MRSSPLADKAFRETIDYELGVTLLDESQTLPLAERESELGKARSYFQKFLLGHPQHPLATMANRTSANILVERGRINQELARQPGRTPERRDRLLDAGPRACSRRRKSRSPIVDTQLNKTQKAFGKLDPNDAATIQRRNECGARSS